MRNFKTYTTGLIVALLFGVCYTLNAQNKKELEQKKNMLQKEIRVTNKLLEETKKNKKLSLNQLVTLNKKINIREELIGTMNQEVNYLENKINENKLAIDGLQADLKNLKDEYARMIYFAYKNQSSYDRMMFIFSSKDFNQAYYRIKYLQQYSDYRRQQAAMILSTQELINKKIAELEVRKNEKLGIVKEKEGEILNLSQEKSEKEKMLIALQDKEKQLKADLKKKQEDAARLQQAIQQIVAAEIKKAKDEAAKKALAEKNAKKKATESNKGSTTVSKEKTTESTVSSGKTGSTGMYLTPEAEKLSNSFEANKSKLPWPVSEGVITSTFGEHEHPVLKNIKTKNNGVDIVTSRNAMARAIYDGEVSGVISIPNAGQAIIIRHGEYLSVYSNLNEVFVKKGDKVKTKQNIASIETDEETGKSEMHLEIWKGNVTLNPELWIFRNR